MTEVIWIANEKELDEALPKVKDPFARLKLCQSEFVGASDLSDNKIYIYPGRLLSIVTDLGHRGSDLENIIIDGLSGTVVHELIHTEGYLRHGRKAQLFISWYENVPYLPLKGFNWATDMLGHYTVSMIYEESKKQRREAKDKRRRDD